MSVQLEELYKRRLAQGAMVNNTNKQENFDGEIFGDSVEEYQISSENKENMVKEYGDVFIVYDILLIYLL